MISSESLVSKYLSSEQTNELIVSISRNIAQCHEDSALLAELISQIQDDVFNQIFPDLFDFVLQIAQCGNKEEYGYATQLIKQSPKLLEKTWGELARMLRYNLRNRYDFLIGTHDSIASCLSRNTRFDFSECEEPSEVFPKELILSLLGFISQMSLSLDVPSSDESRAIDEALFLYLGHKDVDLAQLTCQVFGYRTHHIVDQCMENKHSSSYYWSLIFSIRESSSTKRHTLNAYTIWLRLLGCSSERFRTNSYFQDVLICEDFYWKALQQGLAGRSHETRKYCLSILQLSIKSINRDISTTVFSWKTSSQAQLSDEWSKFTTLYELIGIDTSLHQTQAATNDILDIITTDSLIHPSWGFCLLSTGFQASMDSIRKYSSHILLSIRPESLQLLKYGLPYLQTYFLPYMMLSRHFVVRQKSRDSNELYCEYGEKFSSFIYSVFQSLTTPKEYSDVAFSLLSVLVDMREKFDAVKIYTAFGLVQGLQNQKVLQFKIHDALLQELFNNFSEGQIFSTTVQTLNFRLILCFEPQDLSNYVDLLSKFVSYNGSRIFVDHLQMLLDHLTVYRYGFLDFMKHIEKNSMAEKVFVLVSLATVATDKDNVMLEEVFSRCAPIVIAKILEAGIPFSSVSLQNKINSTLVLAASGTAGNDLYEVLGSPEATFRCEKEIDLEPLWATIQNDIKSDDSVVMNSVYVKMKFFTHTLEILGFDKLSVNFSNLKAFSLNLLTTSGRNIPHFSKLRDKLIGESNHLLYLFVEQFGLCDYSFNELLNSLHFSTVNYTGLKSITKILKLSFERKYMDEQTTVRILSKLLESVKELDASRFRLAERSLHVLLIEVMLHETVLMLSVTNVELASCIFEFAGIIVKNCFGRRGLITTLVKTLLSFQVKYSDLFEKIPFIPSLVVECMLYRELQASSFQIETIIGDLYDKNLSLSKQTPIYEQIYGVPEVAYKVWLLAIVNSIKSSECAEAILKLVFEGSGCFSNIECSNSIGGQEEYQRLQLSKVVVSVIDKVDHHLVGSSYFDKLMEHVENDRSPLVRAYIEWALAQYLLKEHTRFENVFEKLFQALQDHESRPTLVTTYERVLFLMISAMNHENESKYMSKLITILVPAASTNKAVTRHFSMSLAISVHTEIQKKQLNVDKQLALIIHNMYRSALSTEAFGQFRSGDAYLWSATDDLNLTQISGGLLLQISDRDVDFVTEKEFLTYLSDQQKKSLSHPVGTSKIIWAKESTKKSNATFLNHTKDECLPLQTKSGAWSSIMDMDEKARLEHISRSDLIVVASLVDKPPNLGGICRLCDVLGAGLLTIHDSNIKVNSQFKNVAVTADHWMPMLEVKPEDISSYLRDKRAEGYTLIGLEQTDKSRVLDSNLKFPKKSLILLGREKQGIPGDLLAELDFCVEIKQVGVVRSMNIQTATAVIVHAYSSQHC